MIDTVVLTYDLKVDTEHPVRWDRLEINKPSGKFFIKRQLNVELENGAMVTSTYLPYTIERRPQLRVEFSIPNLIFGNNHMMVNNIEEAVPSINFALAEIEGLPSIDAGQGIVRRVDACYNHQVGDAVPYFIKAFTSLEFPYRRMLPYTGQGVLYLNKQASTKFYDKEKESGNSLAHGILRQETTLRREAVQKLTGKKRPRLSDLSIQLLALVLEQDLEKLGIYGRSIGTKDTTLQILSATYGELAGLFYYGLLHAKTNLTSEMIASASSSHPNTMDRRIKKILAAGIPPILTETIEPLQPLVIDIDYAVAQTALLVMQKYRQ